MIEQKIKGMVDRNILTELETHSVDKVRTSLYNKVKSLNNPRKLHTFEIYKTHTIQRIADLVKLEVTYGEKDICKQFQKKIFRERFKTTTNFQNEKYQKLFRKIMLKRYS